MTYDADRWLRDMLAGIEAKRRARLREFREPIVVSICLAAVIIGALLLGL